MENVLSVGWGKEEGVGRERFKNTAVAKTFKRNDAICLLSFLYLHT